MKPTVKFIQAKKEFCELKKRLEVRDDWHEPDNQNIDVVVVAEDRSFDNAFLDDTEKYVVILKDGQQVAAVNLALLFSWASDEKSVL